MATDTDRAEGQAKAQMESITAMVERLEHARECDGDDCELTNEQIYDGLNLYAPSSEATDKDHEMYHDEDNAYEAIQEDPLSIQVRSGWFTPGEDMVAVEFEILLCTGGPACRIRGDLGNYNEPNRAYMEYQDWGTPWTQYFQVDSDALLTYAQQFYFGS